MNFISKTIILFISISSLTVNANVDQYSDMTGGVNVHIDTSAPYMFDTKDINSGNVTITNSTNFFINTSGIYRVSYQLNWNTNSLSRRQVKTYIMKNSQNILNGSYAYGGTRKEGPAGLTTNNASFYTKLYADDFLQLIHKKESSVAGEAYSIPNESTISFELIAEINILDTSGQYGNIALIGTNLLSIQNYSASSSYHLDSPAGAFDGHTYTSVINSDATQKINRGEWVSNTGLNTNQWLQVDFGQVEIVSSFRVVLNTAALNLGRLPKEITVQTSNDGIAFYDEQSFTLDNVGDQFVNLTADVSTRYFRLLISNNYGDSYVQISEFETYQN